MLTNTYPAVRPSAAIKRSATKNVTYCQRLLQNFPYVTLVACLCCTIGGGLFAAENHVLEIQVLQGLEDLNVAYPNLETMFVIMTALGGLIVALSLLIFGADASLTVANLGDSLGRFTETRTPARVFLLLMYPAIPIWTCLLGISVSCLTLAMVLKHTCYNDLVLESWRGNLTDCHTVTDIEGNQKCTNCINVYQFHFMFPSDARKEDMWFCGQKELAELCDLRLPAIVPAWTNCVVGASLTILGIAIHMMVLSYQGANASEQKLLKDLQERHYTSRHVQSAILRRSMHEGSTLLMR